MAYRFAAHQPWKLRDGTIRSNDNDEAPGAVMALYE
jgi:hypothetical protein